MKSRIIFFSLSFIIAAVITLLVSFTADLKLSVFVLTGVLVYCFCFFVVIKSFHKYIDSVVKNIASVLHLKHTPAKWWSFESISLLNSYVQSVQKKFELSAYYISKIGHPEDLVNMDDSIRNDSIGEALRKVQEEMRSLKDEEDKRNWIAQGLAQFSEILRNKSEISEYSHSIISSLVKYLGANQGAFYIQYQDEEGRNYLELTACYAYGKRKFVENKILEGHGLLGQCMLERDFIFITDVPKDYIKITSGLGESTPRNIIVAPLMLNEMFYGVVELALFEILKPHQLEFLKRVSENIASEISSIKTFKQTQQYLTDSKVLTEELQQREEEMRQNMEELVATQEQMERKQTELNSYLSAINNTIASAEFNTCGEFITANEIFVKILGYSVADLAGQRYSKFMADDQSVNMMWDNLRMGKFFSGEFKMKDKSGKYVALNGTFNPISTGTGVADKVMMFAQFVNNQERDKMHDLTVMVNALKSTLPVVEFSYDFVCKTANEKFIKMFGLSRLALKNKTIYDFVDPYYKSVFEKMKQEILKKEFSSMLLPVNINGNCVTYETSVTVSQNLEGKIHRIIVILVKEVEDKVHVLTAV